MTTPAQKAEIETVRSAIIRTRRVHGRGVASRLEAFVRRTTWEALSVHPALGVSREGVPPDVNLYEGVPVTLVADDDPKAGTVAFREPAEVE